VQEDMFPAPKKSLCSKKEESRYSSKKCKSPCVKLFYNKKRNPVFIREKREKLFGTPKMSSCGAKRKKRREVGKKCMFPVPGIEPLLGVSVGM